MSAGSRSLVNWMRENCEAEQSGQRVGQRRLAHAGQILDQQVAAGQQAGDGLTDFTILAEDDRGRLPFENRRRAGAAWWRGIGAV